jgi:hypothetical protein
LHHVLLTWQPHLLSLYPPSPPYAAAPPLPQSTLDALTPSSTIYQQRDATSTNETQLIASNDINEQVVQTGSVQPPLQPQRQFTAMTRELFTPSSSHGGFAFNSTNDDKNSSSSSSTTPNENDSNMDGEMDHEAYARQAAMAAAVVAITNATSGGMIAQAGATSSNSRGRGSKAAATSRGKNGKSATTANSKQRATGTRRSSRTSGGSSRTSISGDDNTDIDDSNLATALSLSKSMSSSTGTSSGARYTATGRLKRTSSAASTSSSRR